jgi:separase
MMDYWESLRAKYRSQATDLDSMCTSRMGSVPSNWTVIHISIGNDNNSLFISRQRGGDTQPPLAFCIPLGNRRDGEDSEEEHLGFEDALKEMEEIIKLNNEGTKVAGSVKEHDDKVKWWKERRSLDNRLRDLLENIEFCWLGAFKV